MDHVDMVTEPGPNRILAENTDASRVDSIKSRVELSVNKHGSRLIAIVGHHDCAGNPADKDEQLGHLHAAARLVQKWGLQAKLILLWINEDWRVSAVDPEPHEADYLAGDRSLPRRSRGCRGRLFFFTAWFSGHHGNTL